MLKLKPSCEHCDKALPPASTEAMICSFECTFCRECVENILQNVCPNCGGGFCPRPIRPAHDRVNGNNLTRYPASEKKVFSPVNLEQHQALAKTLKAVAPQDR